MTDPPTARWARRAFLPHGSAGGPRGTPVIASETPAPPALGSLTPVGHRQRRMMCGRAGAAGACLRKLLFFGGVLPTLADFPEIRARWRPRARTGPAGSVAFP